MFSKGYLYCLNLMRPTICKQDEIQNRIKNNSMDTKIKPPSVYFV